MFDKKKSDSCLHDVKRGWDQTMERHHSKTISGRNSK
jgi:hypothetical protein